MHEITVVMPHPLMLMITLPEGCTEGRWEAAESFAGSVAKIRESYPGKTFQFIPFLFKTTRCGTDPALAAMLAISN